MFRELLMSLGNSMLDLFLDQGREMNLPPQMGVLRDDGDFEGVVLTSAMKMSI